MQRKVSNPKRGPAAKSPSPVQIAITLAGGPGESAKILSFARQNVYRWLRQGIVPDKVLKRVQTLSDATGGVVSVAELLTGRMDPRRKKDG